MVDVPFQTFSSSHHYFAEGLSFLGRRGVFSGWFANGNYYQRRLVFWDVKQLLAKSGVEVAHPTRAKTLFRRCQTDMFSCYGDVYVSVTFPVPSYPLRVVQYRAEDI